MFDYLKEDSIEEFLTGFPTVTRQQAEAVIELACSKATLRNSGIKAHYKNCRCGDYKLLGTFFYPAGFSSQAGAQGRELCVTAPTAT